VLANRSGASQLTVYFVRAKHIEQNRQLCAERPFTCMRNFGFHTELKAKSQILSDLDWEAKDAGD
jgi:hypothetical protein